jgi:hypothetical protein
MKKAMTIWALSLPPHTVFQMVFQARITGQRPKKCASAAAIWRAEAEVEIPHASRNVQVLLKDRVGSQHAAVVGSSSLITPSVRVRKLVNDAGSNDGAIRLREARLTGARSTLVSGREELALEVVNEYIHWAPAQDTLNAAAEWPERLRAIASMTGQIGRIDRGCPSDNDLAGKQGRIHSVPTLPRTIEP